MSVIESIDAEIAQRLERITALSNDIEALRTARDILAARPTVKALPPPPPAQKPVEAPPKAAVALREKTPGEIKADDALAKMRKKAAERAVEAKRLSGGGASLKDIASNLGVSKASVAGYLKRTTEDITAALMGDPSPGRSALDQRGRQ